MSGCLCPANGFNNRESDLHVLSLSFPLSLVLPHLPASPSQPVFCCLQALQDYTTITKRFPDLAISNYARLGRAFMLYQTGNASEAILELEDLEVSLRGLAEVHAALASIVYSERPNEIAYAEQQFDLASEFDGRYMDVEWVASQKQWPPALMNALDKFVNLR